jgi:CRISPR-associated protein Csd1
VLGYVAPDGKPDRVAECHTAFLALLDRCAEQTAERAVLAVQRFLRSDPLPQLELPEDFDPGALITFQVEGAFPIDLPSVRSFWAAENDPALKDAAVLQCVVCGNDRPVLERLQAKIKGVPGGQTSGTSIISANAPAFKSYGLPASLIAPTCADCGERFTKAINQLLADEHSRIVMGGTAFVFWTREYVAFDPFQLITNPEPGQVRALYQSVRAGAGRAAADVVDETRFYATSLSGSGGRTVVRDWIDTTVGEAKTNVWRWFEAQQIADATSAEPRPLRLFALAAATVRDAQKELAPPTMRALVRSALAGAPLPTSLLAQAVQRNRAGQGVTRPRAALIRLVLRSRDLLQEDELVGLNPEHPSPAYHCGRLLAIIEDAQRAAIPGIKATVIDRFFGTASSAPASVFPRLLKGAQPHLSKLERDRPRVAMALQSRLRDALAHVDGFPRILSLEQQGLFALGFYHQHAYDRTRAREAAERRAAGLATSGEDELIAAVEATDDSEKEEN